MGYSHRQSTCNACSCQLMLISFLTSVKIKGRFNMGGYTGKALLFMITPTEVGVSIQAIKIHAFGL